MRLAVGLATTWYKVGGSVSGSWCSSNVWYELSTVEVWAGRPFPVIWLLLPKSWTDWNDADGPEFDDCSTGTALNEPDTGGIALFGRVAIVDGR